MRPAGSYEFDLPAPASVRFIGDALEAQTDTTVVTIPAITRPTSDGPTESVVVSADQIRGKRPLFWANVAPDFSGSWTLGPILVCLECVLTVILARRLQTGDTGSIVSLLLLAPPAIAARADTAVADRFFPLFAWIARLTYALAFAPILLVAFKTAAHTTLAIAGGAAVVAFIGMLINGLAFVGGLARSRRVRRGGPRPRARPETSSRS